MPMPVWLPEYVLNRMEAELATKSVQEQAWLKEQNGIMLYGTIGHQAVLRPDGAVWFYVDVSRPNSPEQYEWQLGEGLERIGALVLGTERFPELAALLPERPANTPDCARCNGSGMIMGKLVCPDCGALGWVPPGAA